MQRYIQRMCLSEVNNHASNLILIVYDRFESGPDLFTYQTSGAWILKLERNDNVA